MILVKDLIEKLKEFPANARVTVYEGEQVGIVIKRGFRTGWIEVGIENEKRRENRDEPLKWD